MSSFIFGDEEPLGWFADSLTILGSELVPCIMLVCGSTFSVGPRSSALGLQTTVGSLFTRLVVMLPLGLGLVLLAHKLNSLPQGDRMFTFVLLLQHTMPTAILCGAMVSPHGYEEPKAASVLFWQYISAVITIAAYRHSYVRNPF